jgi:hypothetical protein
MFSLIFFGIVAVCFGLAPGEPKIIKPLLRGYGVCTLIFAPVGMAEYIIESLELPEPLFI